MRSLIIIVIFFWLLWLASGTFMNYDECKEFGFNTTFCTGYPAS